MADCGAGAAAERMRRIGVLYILPTDDREAQARHLPFQQGLQQLGWTVDRNLHIDLRLAALESCGRYADTRRNWLRWHLTQFWPSVAQRSPRCNGNPNDSDRFRERCRSRWCRSGREHVAAGRQHHRLHEFRVQHGWEVGRIAQGDCTRFDTGCRASRLQGGGGSRTIRCDFGGGPITRGRASAYRRGRSPRDRARCHRVRTLIQWRSNRDHWRNGISPGSDHRACAPLPITRDLPVPVSRRRWRPHQLWTGYARADPSRRRLCRPHPQGREGLPTCRCRSRPSSSWSSTSRPPSRSALKCRRRCSPAPTR